MSESRNQQSNFTVDNLEEEIICTHLRSVQSSGRSPASSNSNNSSGQDNRSLGARDAAVAAGVAGTAGVVAPVAGTAILSGVGFTSAGIGAGSIAAGIQAGIGNVAAGSLFAACQSIGATGGFAILGPVGIGAAAIGGLGYLGIKALRNRRSAGNQEKSTEKQTEKKAYVNEGVINVKPMCLECRRKLLLRITRNFFINNAYLNYHQ